jgi:zinc/manganese transport system substrate-binding protein
VTNTSFRRRASACLILGAALVLAGCGSAASKSATTKDATTTPINIVAGENVWGNIAAQIGGPHVKVTSIISDPNTDPHEYETDPRDAAAVAKAEIVIENGVGYDDFLSDQLKTSGSGKQVLDVQKLVGVMGNDANPHLWYSPDYVRQAAAAIEKQLTSDDSADASTFEANLAKFGNSYQPYIDTINQIKAKYNGDAISYTERVPGYLVDAAGLHLGTPVAFSQAVEDGTDPTPQDTATFSQDIADHRVKVLLYNSQVSDEQTDHIKATATSAGVPIVGFSETIPGQYTNFQDWQIAQAKSLLVALGG